MERGGSFTEATGSVLTTVTCEEEEERELYMPKKRMHSVTITEGSGSSQPALASTASLMLNPSAALGVSGQTCNLWFLRTVRRAVWFLPNNGKFYGNGISSAIVIFIQFTMVLKSFPLAKMDLSKRQFQLQLTAYSPSNLLLYKTRF